MSDRTDNSGLSEDTFHRAPECADSNASAFRINLLDAVAPQGLPNRGIEIRTVSGDNAVAGVHQKLDDNAAKAPADWPAGFKPTGEDFLKDIQYHKNIGEGNTPKLLGHMRDLLSGRNDLPRQPLDWQQASTAAAIGELFLQRGSSTRLAEPFERTNFAENLDLGGQAAHFLTFSRDILARHERNADPAQAQELKIARGHIEARLTAANGDHNITGQDGAFYQLRDMFNGKRHLEVVNFGIELHRKAFAARIDQPESAAKACRDAALFEIAFADHKILKDRIGARELITESEKLLKISQKLDPLHGSDDIRQMRHILDDLNRGQKFDPEGSLHKHSRLDDLKQGKITDFAGIVGAAGLTASSYWRQSASAVRIRELTTVASKVEGLTLPHIDAKLESFRGVGTVGKTESGMMNLDFLKGGGTLSKAESGLLHVDLPKAAGTLARTESGLLQLNGAGTLSRAEANILRDIQLRGLAKGFVTGLGVVGANYVLDEALFKGTRYGTASLIGDTAMPLVALLPTNTYVKGALMVGAHTAGRLVDKYW